jgi:cholesterol transport system auxiliary component
VRLAALLAVTALSLSGCFSGLQSRSPPLQHYLLQLPPPTGTAVAPAHGVALQVQLPVAGPGLNSDAIAVLRAGDRLDYFRGVAWGASAPLMVQEMVIEALRRDGRFAAVEPEASSFAAPYFLSLELAHFEAQYDDAAVPTVQVALVCTLGRHSDGTALASWRAEGRAMAAEDHMQAVIAAFQQATDQALSQLSSITPPSDTTSGGEATR